MAEELLNAITEPHTKVLRLLHDLRIISVDNFKRQHAELMKHHWIDSSILQTFDKQHPATTGIFEVYGKKTGVIIGKTLPLNFLPGFYPLKNFANKTLPGVSEINFFNQMRNPPPSWENPPHRYCDVILHCLKILKIDQSSQALQRNLLALHCFTIEHL